MSLAAIDYQIMWSRLVAVVEEQASTLVRTAFSTSVREAGDLSAGLFDRKSRMIAQAVTGTPGHVNAMAESVGHFVQEIGTGNMCEGDVYVTNDPWMGTGHLHDITMVTPVFRLGRHVGFFAATAHVVDIGGRGFGPDATEIFEEGLQIPIMRFADRGVVDRILLKMIRANVRTPDQTVGDMYSLAACNEVGAGRLQSMMDEFSLDELDGLADFIVDTSRHATRKAISALPDGSWHHDMQVDGYGQPVHMKVRLEIRGDRLRVDFAGTSGMNPRGVNVPEVYTRAYACFGLKVAISPGIPNNSGSLEPFDVTVPEGCILAARRPAPVSVRHVLGHLVPDVVLGALDKAVPGLAPAEGASALWNIHVSARPAGRRDDGPDSEILMFNSGGTGARPASDGLSATAFPSGVSTMSVEATEHVGSVIVWRKELRPDSGGPGEYRGGLGQIIEIEARRGYEFHFNAMFDRVDFPARGRGGGCNGRPGRVEMANGTRLESKGRQLVGEGERLRLLLPGGGGIGEPGQRQRKSVERDRVAGYISESAARDDYGQEDCGS